ncbi:hypothetical protein HFO68_08080 [Rhizobium laguerreae]|uniref:hypothetical protein n=1 Tax=Rhizobium laguerreae TaxID=1076926 RepID=UPI001C90F4E2|nr:hypothetical protein [Rhizobium laguerreae]MBY3104510.1 hypothetical protein [Rhizobium laguerreae]
MGKHLDGIEAFDDGWVKIYKELLADASREELLSPKGHVRRIMQHETGVMFVHAAKKALKKGNFSSSLFAMQSADALVKTFESKIVSVTGEVVMLLKARFYRSGQDDMQTLAHFGLFKMNGRGLYTLTEKGRRYYDYLNNDNVEQFNDTVQLPATPFQVHPGWGYSQIAVYYMPWK